MQISDNDLIIKQLKSEDAKILDEIIKDVIQNDVNRVEEVKSWNDEYTGQHEILNKTQKGTRPNNKIVVNFNKIIIKLAKNYLLANKPNYTNLLNEEDADYNNVSELVKDINLIFKANDEHLHTKEVFEKMMIEKESFEYVYIDKQGDIKITRFPASECKAIYNSQNELDIVLRYYPITFKDDLGNDRKLTKVEIYDNEKVSHYIENEIGNYVPDVETRDNPVYYHMLDENPVIHFVNDDEQSDLEDVKSLSDAYERNLSNWDNEVEGSAFAYLLLINSILGKTEEEKQETVKDLAEYLVLELKGDANSDNMPDARFLEKNIQYQAIESLLDELENKIFLTSMTPNVFRNEDNTNLSSVAIEKMYTLADLKANEKEPILLKGLKKRLRLVNKFIYIIEYGKTRIKQAVNEVNNNKLYLNVNIKFDRNKMINATETIQNINNSKANGSMSNEDAVKQHPYNEDGEKAWEKIQNEQTGQYKEILNAINS